MSLTLSKFFYDKMDLRLFYFHVIICFGRIICGIYAKLESFCYLQETQFHSEFSFKIRFKIASVPAYNLVYLEILWRKTVSVKK